MKRIIKVFLIVILGLYISNLSVMANDFNIAGKVTSNGKAVPEIYIKIYDKDNNRIRDEKSGEALHSLTNAKGEFEFSKLAKGEYILKFRKNDTFDEYVLTDNFKMVKDELVVELKVPDKKMLNIEVNGYKEVKDERSSFSKWVDKWEWQPIWTSIKTALVGILFTFILGLLAVRLIRSIKIPVIQYTVDALLTLPLVLPPTVMGFFLLKFLGVNSVVGRLFIRLFDFRIVFSWESTVIAAVILSLPLMYRSTKGALEQVDTNLIYAARTLGFSERKIFWKILLPNSIPGVASATILAFARGLGEYGATSMIAGNILGKTRTLPIAIAITTSAGQEDQANFYAVIIVIMAIILITMMNVVTIKISKRK